MTALQQARGGALALYPKPGLVFFVDQGGHADVPAAACWVVRIEQGALRR